MPRKGLAKALLMALYPFDGAGYVFEAGLEVIWNDKGICPEERSVGVPLPLNRP